MNDEQSPPSTPQQSRRGPCSNFHGASSIQEAVAEHCWEAALAKWEMQMLSPIRLVGEAFPEEASLGHPGDKWAMKKPVIGKSIS